MKKLNFFISIFALLSVSITANAVPTIHYDLGPTSPDYFAYDYTFASGDVIDDIFLFTIAPSTPESILSTTATSTEIGSFFGVSGFEFALTDYMGTVMSDWGMAGDNIDLYSSVTSGGTYGVYFKGTVTGSEGAVVSGIAAIAPVPVPAAAWLFGSAFLGLFGMSRSRKVTV